MSSKIALCAFGVQGIQKFVSCSLVHHLLMYLCIHGACIACAAMLIIVQARLCGNAHVACGRARNAHRFKRIDVLPSPAMWMYARTVEVFPSPSARIGVGGLRSLEMGPPKRGAIPTGGVGNTSMPMALMGPVSSTALIHCCHPFVRLFIV